MTRAIKRHPAHVAPIGGGHTMTTEERCDSTIIRDGVPVLLASYALGDYVVPTDLPRPFLCRVTYAHVVEGTPLQVLELAPLAGPWPRGTRLVRGSDWVRPAVVSELSVLRRHRDPGLRPHRHRRPADQPAPRRSFPQTRRSCGTPIGTGGE